MNELLYFNGKVDKPIVVDDLGRAGHANRPVYKEWSTIWLMRENVDECLVF